MNKSFLYSTLFLIVFFQCKDKNTQQVPANVQPVSQGSMTIPDYWQNPSIWEFGREAPRADFKPMEEEAKAIGNQFNTSKYHLNLNGFWKYQFFIGPNSVPADIEKTSISPQWLEISMPGFAELKNLGKPIFKYYSLPFEINYPSVPQDTNSVLVLKKSITIPEDWNGRDVFAVFDGISCSYFLYINGELTGYNEDTKNSSEYNITSKLKSGENDISLILIRWSDGSYFETHNQWSLTGINRNSYLLARPKLRIGDFQLQTDYKNNLGILQSEVKINNQSESNQNGILECKILDYKTKSVISSQSSSFQINPKTSHLKQFVLQSKDIKSWSDETPNVYDCIITIKDNNSKVIESASSIIGFLHLEYRNTLTINGKPIKIKGVVCHEFHPINGNILDKEWMDNDMDVMKLHNINAIRNNHYPFDAYWYETSLRFGQYIMDECNLNLSALTDSGKFTSNDSNFTKCILQRIINTYERNKNHTNIISWSLGYNLMTGKNQQIAYDYIKSRTKNRPVISYSTDSSLGDLEVQNESNNKKPILLYTIGRARGTGLGGFADRWLNALNKPNFAGGFIEDFTDQCFYMKNKSGQLFFGYGGVFGETKSDSFLCAGGLLTANKTPNHTLKFVSPLFSNLIIKAKNLEKGIFTIYNNYNFDVGGELIYFWSIDYNSEKIKEGKFEGLKINPGQNKDVSVDLQSINLEEGKEYCIVIHVEKSYTVKGMHRFVPEKIEKFCLPIKPQAELKLSEYESLNSSENQNKIEIGNTQFKVSINRQSGFIDEVNMNGKKYLDSPIYPIFYRAATDDDILTGKVPVLQEWKNIWKGARLINFLIEKNDPTKFLIKEEISFDNHPELKAEINYIIYSSGDIIIELQLSDSAMNSILPARVSWTFDFDPLMGSITWYGRGPYDSYPDRKLNILKSVYQSNVTDFNVIRVRPQEMSNKSDCSWLDLSTFDGYHISIYGQPLIDFKVLPFSYESLDRQYKYGTDLKPGKRNCILFGREIWPINDTPLNQLYWIKGQKIKTSARLKFYKSDKVEGFRYFGQSLP